jgi:hypothetical protein
MGLFGEKRSRTGKTGYFNENGEGALFEYMLS